MTRRGVRLSLAAVDVLWETLALGTPPVIFEVPSVGATLEARAHVRNVVVADLTRHGLADHHGRVDPDLTLLARAPIAVEAIGLLGDGQRLCARAASSGRIAVLAILREQSVRLERIRPTGVVAAMLELIGPARPGRGRSVTYPEAAQPTAGRTATEGRASGVLQPAFTTPTGYDAQREQARVILSQPRTQAGLFIAFSRDSGRPERERGVLLWFDTPTGRYLGHRKPGAGGHTWTTYAPADSTRLAQHLSELIADG
jgi:hypothetical protein